MKIIACVRTLNEQANIFDCCNAYHQFADELLIADGGSTDDTKLIASYFPKVKIRDYTVKVECQNGILRNPDGPHIQFLVDWATEEGADWIIVQDCDQRPNKFLKGHARKIFEETDQDFVMAIQIYLWGKDMYFPNLTYVGGEWMKGLWAWRASIGLKILDNMPHFEFSLDGKTSIDIPQTNRVQYVGIPYCYMHFGWPDIEKTTKHVEYYRQSGLIPQMLFPTQFGGEPKPLLEWMVE